jgi:hypothetical protein
MRTFAIVLTVLSLSPGFAQQAPSKPPATQHEHDAAIKGSGKLPEGWQARFDDASAKPDQVIVEEKDKALTFTTGPAGIYYKPDMKAQSDYDYAATFSQLKPAPMPEGYGLFISGRDLDKDTQRYTYFLVRQDGKFLLKSRSGTATKTIVDWKDAPSMKEPKGVKTSNTLQIRAVGDAVTFYVNDKQVDKLTRAAAGGDGIAGLRVNHMLNVQVSKLSLKKLK